MPDEPPPDASALSLALIRRPAEHRVEWVAAHHDRLSVDLIAALKQRSDPLLISDPRAADDITQLALLVAQHLPHTSLALPLASWARGNWEAYHDPHAAILSYQRALAGYQPSGEQLSVARLLSNLVFAYCDCGNFSEAQAAYQQARAIFVPLGEPAALYLLRLEQNYGWLLHSQGQYTSALELYDRAIRLAHRLDQPIIVLEVQVNRVVTLGMLGRLDEGEALLLRERVVAEEHQQQLTIARIDLNLGWLNTAQGKPADALRRFQAAREQFAALDNRMDVATVLLLEAALFERHGALSEARHSYAQAQARFAELETLPLLGNTLLRSAAANRLYGTFTHAARLLDQAESLWQALDQPVWCAAVLLERSALALAQRDPRAALAVLLPPLPALENPALAAQRDVLYADAQALQYSADNDTTRCAEARLAYKRALTYAQAQGDRWMQRQALAGLGRLALAEDPALARQHLEAAATLDDITRQALSVEELKAGFQTQTGELLPLLAQLALVQGQAADALVCAWRAKGSALLDLLYASAADDSPAEQGQVEQLRQQIAGLRWKMARVVDEQPSVPHERAHPAIGALEHQLYELRRRHNRSATAIDIDLLNSPPQLLAHMNADLLIEYLSCDDKLLAIRADRAGQCSAEWLADTSTILDLLEDLHLGFQNVLAQPIEHRVRYADRWISEARPLLQRCYDLLIAPLGPLPPTARLLIAPCDPLYLLPFASLWDGRGYLVERHEIQITPSGALLAARPGVAAAGAPLIVAASAEGRLGGVANELAAVREALPDSIGMLDDPQALGYLTALHHAPRILHISAHSVLREDAPIFSGLQLTGGMLSLEQCYDLKLAGTELVTLSGCTTATGMDTGGSLLAFQSAFFVAGAQQVLSSLWPIDDSATAAWMGRFYQLLASGQTAAAALRATQRALLADPATRHPAIWAAFICSRR